MKNMFRGIIESSAKVSKRKSKMVSVWNMTTALGTVFLGLGAIDIGMPMSFVGTDFFTGYALGATLFLVGDMFETARNKRSEEIVQEIYERISDLESVSWKTFLPYNVGMYAARTLGLWSFLVYPFVFRAGHMPAGLALRIEHVVLLIGFGLTFIVMGNREGDEETKRIRRTDALRDENERLKRRLAEYQASNGK